ncbi:hypothetical protein ZHAS_00019923 [Anopheles sinensis]|uniref:Secreted protein n=1 Tax=Anopheles sinensis TaxID=74873 RepID=A0A084WMJ8_ANOSI|nr:hypothetical protein ZHAS_00019923 [Anopheles sinensis]
MKLHVLLLPSARPVAVVTAAVAVVRRRRRSDCRVAFSALAAAATAERRTLLGRYRSIDFGSVS